MVTEISELTTRLRELASAANGEGYYVDEADLLWRLPMDAQGPRRDDFLDKHEREFADSALKPLDILCLLDHMESLEKKLSKAQEANRHYAGLTFADGGNP